MPVKMAGRRNFVKPGTAQCALALACALLLAVKFWLVWRLNINWDEFYYLSQVHAAARGEITQALQTGYIHLFAWLTLIDGNEIAQIHVARVLMVVLLGISVVLIQRLAARWFPPVAAWAAALTFLAMWPTLKHGGSFRADSLLLPLQLAALVVLTQPGSPDRKRGLGAGVLLGVATAVSVKAVLLAPVVIVLGLGDQGDWRRGLRRLAWLAGGAALTAVALIGANLLSMGGPESMTATGAVAEGAWQKTLRDAPWFPQPETLREMVHEDWMVWVAAAAGVSWAVWRRLWSVAACALALLPVAFYRNSFAYYYVVMWGTACVTIAAAVTGVQEMATRGARPAIANALTLAFAALLGTQGLRDLPFLSHQRQEAQRQLVAAVHAIFPDPVPYIDHSGMISSFRKANFFMSTWGVENYLARGRSFMRRAIERHKPPLLISNRAELVPGSGNFNLLLAEDRQIIENSYLPYWGPIRIAGAELILVQSGPEPLVLPFAGAYRLECAQPVVIDGVLRQPGDVIEVGDNAPALDISLDSRIDQGGPVSVRMLWAGAAPPPAEPPVSMNYYDGL